MTSTPHRRSLPAGDLYPDTSRRSVARGAIPNAQNRAASDAPTKNFRACVLQRIRQQNAEAETGFVIVVVDQRITVTAEYLYQSLETLA